jgi:hypothetical protein
MSIEVRFSLSKGLKAPITVPKGTLKDISCHIAEMVVTISPCDGGPLWGRLHSELTDEALCEAAQRHNNWLARLWATFFPPQPHKGDTEQITPDDAQGFWFALRPIEVPMNRWTKEYAVLRLEEVFHTLRGRPQRGVHFDAKPLSIEQASAAIYVVTHLFGLDVGTLDPEAPRMWVQGARKTARLEWVDEVQTNACDTGEGYEMCVQCGAVARDAGYNLNCPRRKCPLKNEEEG